MFSEVMRYILDLGPTVMLPIVIIIFSKILGMKAGDCFKAGLHIGIGFVGIGLVIGLMLDSIGPAAKAMAENFDLNLHVVDVGWPGSSPMTWASLPKSPTTSSSCMPAGASSTPVRRRSSRPRSTRTPGACWRRCRGWTGSAPNG